MSQTQIFRRLFCENLTLNEGIFVGNHEAIALHLQQLRSDRVSSVNSEMFTEVVCGAGIHRTRWCIVKIKCEDPFTQRPRNPMICHVPAGDPGKKMACCSRGRQWYKAVTESQSQGTSPSISRGGRWMSQLSRGGFILSLFVPLGPQ